MPVSLRVRVLWKLKAEPPVEIDRPVQVGHDHTNEIQPGHRPTVAAGRFPDRDSPRSSAARPVSPAPLSGPRLRVLIDYIAGTFIQSARVDGMPECPLASGLTPSTWWTLIRDASKPSAEPAM